MKACLVLALASMASLAVSARANQAPTGTVRVNTTSIAAGQQVVVSVDATDADGNLHYINIDQISPTNGFYGPGDTGTESPPNNGAYDLGGYFGSRTRDLTLTLNTPGTYVFRGAMNDDSGWHYTTNTVSVTVTNANQPPSGTVRVNTTSIYAGQQVVVSVDATDANGNLHYINIDQTSPTNGFYGPGDTGTESPPNNGAYDLGGYFGSRTRDLTLTLNTPGTYVFRGAMNDDSGWYYTPNTVSVTVINANQPPTGTVRVNATSIYTGQQVVVSVDATDANGNLHYINIDQISPTNGFYGPGDTGTQTPPNNGAYDLGGYFGSRTRNLTLTLNAAGTYVFRGAMNDDSGWNYTSNTVSVSVGAPPDTTPPGAPQNLLISGLTNTGFTISWAAPSGEAAAGYRVRLDSGGFTDVGANTSHSFAGLAAGSSHAVEVQARDAASNWSMSASYGVTTTTSGGGGTQASDSNWVDVDNDGILDEVVRAGTEEFYYYVNQWSTANAQYAYLSINNFWEAFTVIWPPSWSWENFTMVWDYEPIFWVGYETSFDLTFEVMTGSNEPFAIYRDPSESPDITLSDWQLVAEHPGYVYGGLQIINYPLPNATFLPGAQFFLVKEGRPLGFAQIKDTAGNMLATNFGANGTVTLDLPADGKLTIPVYDDLGHEIPIEEGKHGLTWVIEKVVNGVTTTINGVGKILDVSPILPLPNGQVVVKLKLDEGQYFTFVLALPNAPSGPSIAFVKDGGNDHAVDSSDPAIGFARIGHWGADRADGGVDGYEDGLNGGIRNNATPDNFIDKDPERFYVRVANAAPNSNPNAKDTITVKIGTLLSNNASDDDLTDITLEETGNNTGVFVSEAQLLVGPDISTGPDDVQIVRSKYSAALLSDDATNDRSHRATVDGSVRVEYQAGGQPVTAQIPVCSRSPDARRVLNVVVHHFNEPWQDANGNGQFDPGELYIDISNSIGVIGGPQFTSAYPENRGPIWTDEQINLQMAALGSVLAQADIRVVEAARILHNPLGKLFAQDGNETKPPTTGRFDAIDDNVTEEQVSRDHVIIQTQGFRSASQFNGDDSDDVIDIYFVAPFTSADYGARGFQFRPAFVASGNLATNLINSVFVSYEAATDSTVTTLAHEILHQLTNKGHSTTEQPRHIVFPSGEGAATGDGSGPLWRRRIQQATAEEARTARPSASMTAIGNRLLRNP